MYCCKCGTRVGSDAEYCHKCGAPLHSEQEKRLAAYRRSQHGEIVDPVERALMQELLATDPKPWECQGCGDKDDLSFWDFGLGKPISIKREWTETALSIAISAATIPLAGVGLLRLPGRSVSLHVVPLKLVLCPRCHVVGYQAHPWWTILQRYGYTEFIPAESLGSARASTSA